MVLNLPFYVRQWSRTFDAAKRADWMGVIECLLPLEERGVGTNESRLWLAESYARLENWVESVAQFELIDRPLRNHPDEARRRYNHAYALARLHRIDEAAALLDMDWDTGLSPDLTSKLKKLREYLREGHVGDARTLH